MSGRPDVVAPSIGELPAPDPAELRITRLRALRGPNYWRLAPVIACDLSVGSLAGLTSGDVPGFADALERAMPTLRSHPCSRERESGFLERLREGTGWAHVLEHVALELQSLAGANVAFGRVVGSESQDSSWVILEYEEEEVGLQAVRRGVEVMRACLGGTAPDLPMIVAELTELRIGARLGPSTAVIVEEARRRGIPVRRLNTGSLVQLGLGRSLRRIRATATDATSIIASDLAQDKDLTKRVLLNIGLAVPAGAVAKNLERALEVAREIGYPVMLKPLDGNQGRGISPRLGSEEEVMAAWAQAERFGSMVVERYVDGRDHRVLVVNGKVVAVAERVPAHVVGDGTSSIRSLVEQVNSDPRRGTGHSNILTALPLDQHTEEVLARRGLTLESVPSAGERVLLRATANLSTGGTAIDRTDEIHPDNVTACEMAAGVVGLDIAGIDVLTPDIGVPFEENGAVIIEINAVPGIRMHEHPSEGRPRHVAAAILDMLFPAGARPTIPVIAVTGTNGKTTTTRLIAHLFRATGRTVGFTTTDGVYLQNRLVVRGDMTGPFAANVLLSNPTVEVAVLETARGGILRSGLGFDECDVGIVLNVAGDHLGLHGIHTLEQLADVKAVIPSVVKRRGTAVLNADDPLVAAMADRTRGDVVYFTTVPDRGNPLIDAHLETGGTAACIEDGEFVIRRGRLCIPIAAVHEVPLTVEGLARFQYGNVLAAIAATFVQGMRYEDIRAGLLSFFPSPALTPGRLNLLRVRGGTVLVDYAHNPRAVEGLMDVALGVEGRRRLGVLGAPGDRRDEDIREVGRLCARLDRVLLKEDDDRRGRAPGEVARLLEEGLREAGLSPDRIETVFAEPDAMARALGVMQDGDLLVVLAEDVSGVLTAVRPRASGETRRV
jgi:cyanophycin synthetase